MLTFHARRRAVSPAPATAPTSLGTTIRQLAAKLGVIVAFGLAGAMATAASGPAGTPAAQADHDAQAIADAAAAIPVAPSEGELYPLGITAEQQRFVPSPEQMTNARTIVDVGRSLGLPPRAWVIAVSTALQESSLHNLGYLGASNDHDSLGLFQQRPSTGWGTPEQVTDPTYAATAFYNRLRRVSNWPSLPLTVAAQTVQISAFPNYYAKHEWEAGDIVRGLYGEGPFTGIG